jgi:hypothetical protein
MAPTPDDSRITEDIPTDSPHGLATNVSTKPMRK